MSAPRLGLATAHLRSAWAMWLRALSPAPFVLVQFPLCVSFSGSPEMEGGGRDGGCGRHPLG